MATTMSARAPERIATATPRVRGAGAPAARSVARLIAGASFVIGVDTGLLHLARRSACRWSRLSRSEPGLTGPIGQGPIAVLAGTARPPSVAEVADTVKRLHSAVIAGHSRP